LEAGFIFVSPQGENEYGRWQPPFSKIKLTANGLRIGDWRDF